MNKTQDNWRNKLFRRNRFSKVFDAHVIFWLILIVALLISIFVAYTEYNTPVIGPIALSFVAGILSGIIINGLYSVVVFKEQVQALTEAVTLNENILREVFKEEKVDTAIESLLKAKLEDELGRMVKKNVIDKIVEFKSLAFETREMALVFKDINQDDEKYQIGKKLNEIVEGLINLEKLRRDFIHVSMTYESMELLPPNSTPMSRFIATDNDDEYVIEEAYEVEKHKSGEINQYTYFLPAELSELISIEKLIEALKEKESARKVEELICRLLFDVEEVFAGGVRYQLSSLELDKNLLHERGEFKVIVMLKAVNSEIPRVQYNRGQDPVKIEWKAKTILNKNEGYFFDSVKIPYNKVEYVIDYSKLTDVKYFTIMPICSRHVSSSRKFLDRKLVKVSFDGWTFPLVSVFISWVRENPKSKEVS